MIVIVRLSCWQVVDHCNMFPIVPYLSDHIYDGPLVKFSRPVVAFCILSFNTTLPHRNNLSSFDDESRSVLQSKITRVVPETRPQDILHVKSWYFVLKIMPEPEPYHSSDRSIWVDFGLRHRYQATLLIGAYVVVGQGIDSLRALLSHNRKRNRDRLMKMKHLLTSSIDSGEWISPSLIKPWPPKSEIACAPPKKGIDSSSFGCD